MTGIEPRADAPNVREVGAAGLWVVRVRERTVPEIAGHTACSYDSPPQPRAQALALVDVLLGSPAGSSAAATCARWAVPIAGGARVITLEPA